MSLPSRTVDPIEVKLPDAASQIINEYCGLWEDDNIRRVRQMVSDILVSLDNE